MTFYLDLAIAVEWDKNGRTTKFVNEFDEKTYSEHQYKKCSTLRIKRYQNDELFYSVDFHWDGNLLTQKTSHFHGVLKEAIGKSTETTKSNFVNFDKEGNWTKRNYSQNKKTFMEDRRLAYY